VDAAQITVMQGRTLASTDPTMMGKLALSTKEKTYLHDLSQPVIFSAPGLKGQQWEAVAAIRQNGKATNLVWIYPNETQDKQDLRSLVGITLFWAACVLLACTGIAAIVAQSLSRQLRLLTGATRRLIQNPEDTADFPVPVKSATEAADLTIAFNRMVAAMQDQRAGLNETLALLDSMLANAPIGFAFFDRKYRFVRVNQFLADMNGYSFALHLGRGVDGIVPPAPARKLEQSIETVFVSGEPQRNVELLWEAEPGKPRSWLAHLYPVRTEVETTRWVGAILVDTTEQKRAEETLRRTEKLAAAGRLAASIAHEINNPLEAVTNLLYLIRQEDLSPDTAQFAEMAQQEVARVSEITQQTLRFYRQSTLPGIANVREILDSNAAGRAAARIPRRSAAVLLRRRIAAAVCQPDWQCAGRNDPGGRPPAGTRAQGRTAGAGGRACIRNTGIRRGYRMRDYGRGAPAHFRAVLHDQGSDGDRPGIVGERTDHPQAQWIGAGAQPLQRTVDGNGVQRLLPGHRAANRTWSAQRRDASGREDAAIEAAALADRRSVAPASRLSRTDAVLPASLHFHRLRRRASREERGRPRSAISGAFSFCAFSCG
jgi:PAS domain S-box-containing protein